MRRALLLLAACGHAPPTPGPDLVPPPRCVEPAPVDLTGGCDVVGGGVKLFTGDGRALDSSTVPIGDVIAAGGSQAVPQFWIGHCGGGEFDLVRDLSELATVSDHVEAPDGVIATEVPGLAFSPAGAPSREIDVTRGAESYRLFYAADPGDLTPPVAGTAAIEGDAPHPMLVVDDGQVTALHCVHTLADVEEIAIFDPDNVTVYEASTGHVIATHANDDAARAWLDTI